MIAHIFQTRALILLALAAAVLATSLAPLGAPRPARAAEAAPAAQPTAGEHRLFLPAVAKGGAVQTPPGGTPPGGTPPGGTPPPPPPGAIFVPGSTPTRGLDAAYDAQNGLHITYISHSTQQNDQKVHYAYCAPGRDCDSPASWETTVVRTGTFGGVQIEVTRDGRPRLMFETDYTLLYANFVYAECNAGCAQAASWGTAQLTSAPIQLVSAFGNETSRLDWFRLDPQDRPRFITPMHGAAFYGSCDRDCLQDNWGVTEIRVRPGDFDARELDRPVLRFSPDGRAHILANNRMEIVYLTCAATCEQAASWEVLFLSFPGTSTPPGMMGVIPFEWDLEIDPSGQVIVGVLGDRTDAANARIGYIWTCQGSCASLERWGGFNTGLVAGGFDLGLSRQGTPFFISSVVRAADRKGILTLARCVNPAACYTSSDAWVMDVVDSQPAMEAELPIEPFLPPVCGRSTLEWRIDAGRVLFDAAGRVRIFGTGTAAAICRGSAQEYTDQWGTVRQRRDTDIWTFTHRARLIRPSF